MAQFLDVIVEDGLNYASDCVENNFAGKLGRLPANGANLGRLYDANSVARDHEKCNGWLFSKSVTAKRDRGKYQTQILVSVLYYEIVTRTVF